MAETGLKTRGFRGLVLSQALTSFNDNAFKTLVGLRLMASLPPGEAAAQIAVVGAVFVLPFIVFSAAAGALADRMPKNFLLLRLKQIELILMAAAIPALAFEHRPSLFALVFLMGVHSAFFSPAKQAIVPELVKDGELSHANGLMQMAVFLAIVLGTVTAGTLAAGSAARFAGLVFVFLAAVGVGLMLLVPHTAERDPARPLPWNAVAQTWRDIRGLENHPGVLQAVVGTGYFWFLGAVFQMNLLVYGKELMGVSEEVLSRLQVALAAGIGAGSYLAGRMSRRRIELGLVPLGALGLVAFGADLAFSYRSVALTVFNLACFGAACGCFAVPLQSFIQSRTPADSRGRVLAAANTISFVAILVASASLWMATRWFHLASGQVFLVAAAMTLVVAIYLCRLLPDALLRLPFYALSNLIYRIDVRGGDRLPIEGPALLVANHVSFVDAFLIAGASERPINFLMFRRYYDIPVANWFFRAMGCIPISDADGPREMIRSLDAARERLKAGAAVCIFAEGEITRHGQMLRFKKGFERIVSGLDVPIVPVHLDRVWGSVFSFEGGKPLLKWPRRIPYPVTVSFGRPMPSSSSAHDIRQQILELGAEAFELRLAERKPLPLLFLREAKRHPLRFALADSLGARLNYGTALTQARALGRALDAALEGGENAGLLLPPSAAAALANLGLSLAGRVPINLNYTTSLEVVLQCAEKAGIRRILTTRKLVEKLGWDLGDRAVYVEDVAKTISKPGALLAGLAMLALPLSWVERWFFPKARGPLDRLATVIFTSGSTGLPKGVMLTHKNVLANLEGMAQVYQVRKDDRIVGVLPFFHSFGYSVTLWFPLVSGFGVVYHPNPLDARKIGELSEEFRATFLLGTPTFLASYLRRVEPEKFKTLRYVVVGAEKLRDDLAVAFRDRFGMAPLEGYGCTELSPVAAVNIPDISWPGVRQKGTKLGTVGQPLPGVLAKVVDPDTHAPRAEGETGLLLIKGANVMKGYLGDPDKTAEVVRDGYYVTGDIASIDADGFLTITDRLSRFSKIGGEMVPHIKVEAKLHELAGRVEQTFVVTAVPDEKKGERLVVLVKGYDDVEGLAKRLQETELPKLWLPDRAAFFAVPEFPVLGSGKLDLQRLKAVAKQLASTPV
ncbi:MAG: MFS transporter [Elusimicrobia bacterium]|nr:MFS transporter [Elusimicrobiota bacterium]